MGMQSALHLIYPPQCLSCEARVATDFGLCAACWRETPFVTGLVCDKCGLPLPGEESAGIVFCDDCLTIARPWDRGRSALLYRDNGRRMVLALKHGDRLDLVRPAAEWMYRVAQPLLEPDMLIAPVPLHWLRLLRRRYNQAALLSRAFARRSALDHCPDLLIRRRRMPSQEGRDRDARFANVQGAITAHPKRSGRIAGRKILLVDDVMTSGATLAACAEACHAAGATQVSIVALARVAKDAQIPIVTPAIGIITMPSIEIYTSPTCGFCHAAKRLLREKGAEFTEIDVSRDPARKQAMIARAQGRYTVPQIFVGNTHVGGCDDLYDLERAGKLDPLLAG